MQIQILYLHEHLVVNKLSGIVESVIYLKDGEENIFLLKQELL